MKKISEHASQTEENPDWKSCLALAGAELFRLNFAVKAMINYPEMIGLIYNDSAWFDLSGVDRSWEDALTRAQDANSDLKTFISVEEYNELILLPNQYANQSLVSNYIIYYNRTMYSYSLNITEPNNLNDTSLSFMSLTAFANRISKYARDVDYCRSLGYSNIFHAYIDIFQQYYDANKNSPVGICATVTIRIVQNVTITRQGFDAELTIDNSGDVLYDIQVSLNIQADNRSNANDRFSIGQANITGDIFNDSLTTGGSGQFNWLIIPYVSAAPTTSTSYSVGGQLSYTVAGQRVNITLFPDRIQVDPEARIDIAYFLEEKVIGPDPLSNQWIVPQPFILAVVVTNSGYGWARNFQISSGQPTIVDNEKGFLVTFSIIEMKINREQQPKVELSATIGDLQPFCTWTITWTMLSSAQGYFRIFNASYIEKSPNGDAKLSLLNSLTTHSLQHVVSLDILVAELNDSQIDYLVNQSDGKETVYSSTNATLFFPVVLVTASVEYYSIDHDTQRLIVNVISNLTLDSCYIHLSVENSFPQYIVISSKRIDDNQDITINTWLTHNVNHLQSGDQTEDLLHIFDMTSLSSNRTYEVILISASNTTTTTTATLSVFLNSTLTTISMLTQETQLFSATTETISATSLQYSTSNKITSSSTSSLSMMQSSLPAIISTGSFLLNSSPVTPTKNNGTLMSSTFQNSITTKQIESTRMKDGQPGTTDHTFTHETTSSSMTTKVNGATFQTFTYETASSSLVTTPSVTTNTYIQFTLSFSVEAGSHTETQLALQLLVIFTSALGIHSNQINITVSMPMGRTLTYPTAKIRLFDSKSESADSLLARIRQQLADPSSILRRDQLTSQLTNESISDVKRVYICDDGTEQEIPCGVNTTTQPISTSSLTTMLLVTIIPTTVGTVLLGAVVVLTVRYLRSYSRNSPFKYRSSREMTRF